VVINAVAKHSSKKRSTISPRLPLCVEGGFPGVGYLYVPDEILHRGDALPDTSGVTYLPNDARSGHIGSALHPRAKEKPMSNQRSVVGVSSPQSLEGHSLLSALALAGIAGPIIFAVVDLMHSLLREDHSLWEHPVSALAAGPSGWIQNVNFLLFGSLMIAYAIGLHLGVGSSRRGVVVGGLVRPPGSPLHAWFGLFQWALLAVWLPCTVILALRLLRLTRVVEGPR
jgi:hypothetical protein